MAQKPRLTDAAVKRLRSLAAYATCEAEVVLDGTPDQAAHAKEVIAGAEWVKRLCDWHDGQAGPPSDDELPTIDPEYYM